MGDFERFVYDMTIVAEGLSQPLPSPQGLEIIHRIASKSLTPDQISLAIERWLESKARFLPTGGQLVALICDNDDTQADIAFGDLINDYAPRARAIGEAIAKGEKINVPQEVVLAVRWTFGSFTALAMTLERDLGYKNKAFKESYKRACEYICKSKENDLISMNERPKIEQKNGWRLQV